MKLRTKILVASISAAIIFTVTCSAFLLYNCKQDLLDSIEESQKKLFEVELRNVTKSMNKSLFVDMSNVMLENIVVFQIRNGLSGDFAIYQNKRELYNCSAYSFTFSPTSDTDTNQFESQLYSNGRIKKLLIFTRISFCDIQYDVIKVIDLSLVYERISSLLLREFVMLVFLCLFAGGGLYLLLKHILRPFQELKNRAAMIAEGNYTENLSMESKDEVGELARSFNLMAVKVEEKILSLTEMNERQNLMLGSIAHELKTPLTAMIGYADTLQRIKLSKAKEEKALGYIAKESKRLSELSAKIMELTGLQSGEKKIERQMVSIKKMIRDAETIIQHKIYEKKIHVKEIFEVDDILLKGDSHLLTSLFINLIENAVKASEIEGIIEVHLRKEKIIIKDYGVGIKETELAHILEPFYMVDKSRSRKQGGAGIGLSLCKEIAYMHHMNFYITSQYKKGSEAVLEIVFKD